MHHHRYYYCFSCCLQYNLSFLIIIVEYFTWICRQQTEGSWAICLSHSPSSHHKQRIQNYINYYHKLPREAPAEASVITVRLKMKERDGMGCDVMRENINEKIRRKLFDIYIIFFCAAVSRLFFLNFFLMLFDSCCNHMSINVTVDRKKCNISCR